MSSNRLLRTAVPLAAVAALPAVWACNSARSPDGLPRESAVAGPSLTPLGDGVRFSPAIRHPYLPLSAVRYAELQSADETVVREVLDQTKVVGGVECLVLAEKEYQDGELQEISYNYFAEDERGNVYYFGEDVDDYRDGVVVGHGGAWLVGRNAQEPCLFMAASLRAGLRYKSENSPPDAEEWDEIAALDVELSVPAGTYRDVLVVKEGDRPDRLKERKYYAPGVGLISENRKLNLVLVRIHDQRDTER